MKWKARSTHDPYMWCNLAVYVITHHINRGRQISRYIKHIIYRQDSKFQCNSKDNPYIDKNRKSSFEISEKKFKNLICNSTVLLIDWQFWGNSKRYFTCRSISTQRTSNFPSSILRLTKCHRPVKHCVLSMRDFLFREYALYLLSQRFSQMLADIHFCFRKARIPLNFSWKSNWPVLLLFLVLALTLALLSQTSIKSL